MVEMAVRLGLQKFLLIDSDNVTLSNLNRQAFHISDIGKLKVQCLKQKLLSINPDVEVFIMQEKIDDLNNIEYIISQSTVIINTIDCGVSYFSLVDLAMKKEKLVVCPFNPGFGGLVVCFNHTSGTLYDLLNTDQIESGLAFSKKLILNNPDILIPKEMRSNINLMFDQVIEKNYEPQLAIGVHLSSAIGLSCIIKYLNGESIPYCPSIIYRGLYDI
jgi:molybdopterin-synthase adenylyltransferase